MAMPGLVYPSMPPDGMQQAGMYPYGLSGPNYAQFPGVYPGPMVGGAWAMPTQPGAPSIQQGPQPAASTSGSASNHSGPGNAGHPIQPRDVEISSELVRGVRGKIMPEVKLAVKKELRKNNNNVASIESSVQEAESAQAKWFGLPDNCYGAGMWAVLVLEVEASGILLLVRSRNSENVPLNQRWAKKENTCLWPLFDVAEWYSKRLAPFTRSIFFILSTILLGAVSWLLQFGFTWWLDTKIGGLDEPDSQKICVTSGWVQYMSVGFFLAVLVGQLPSLLRTLLLIWTSDRVRLADDAQGSKSLWAQGTPEEISRMLVQAKNYSPSWEGMLPEGHREFVRRTKGHHLVRRLLATLFPVAEGAIIGYLLVVGVKYIFWSGYIALERSPNAFFPNFDLAGEGGGYPWMTNTAGVEEIILATLALQFIMDIDEYIFKVALPKSIQTSVLNTELNCSGWFPSSFRRADFLNIGKHVNYTSNAEHEADEDKDYSGHQDIWKCGYLRLKVLKQMKSEFERDKEQLKDKQTEMQDNKSQPFSTRGRDLTGVLPQRNPGFFPCCSVSSATYQQTGVDVYATQSESVDAMMSQLKKDLELMSQLHIKIQRMERFFRLYFWDLYNKAMKDTFRIAQEFDAFDGSDQREMNEHKAQYWRHLYLYFDKSNSLWLDVEHPFWTALENGKARLEKDDKTMLTSILQDVTMRVGNEMRRAIDQTTTRIRGEDKRGEGYNPCEPSDYNVNYDVSIPGRVEPKNLMYRFYDLHRAEISEMIDLTEEFVAKPVRHAWMNLLPDATFLLSFVLITLPAMLVRVVRGRMGCMSWDAVDLDDLPNLERTDASTLFREEGWAITVPLTISMAGALFALVVLAFRAYRLWTSEENADKKRRREASKKKATQEAATKEEQENNERQAARAAANLSCESRHPLVLENAPYEAYGCDRCGGGGNGERLRCDECNYDLCDDCVEDMLLGGTS